MFEELSLHDATLHAIHFAWKERRCVLQLATGRDGVRALIFAGVSGVDILRQQPWGASVSVNSLRQSALGIFEVEMQSGDIVRIAATSWELK